MAAKDERSQKQLQVIANFTNNCIRNILNIPWPESNMDKDGQNQIAKTQHKDSCIFLT